MDDLIVEFLTETNENLGELDIALLHLEQNPTDKDLLGKIFRVMHTIKGTSGFLNLPRLGAVAHKAEDLLGLFREEKLTANPSSISLILEVLDRIKMIMLTIEQSGKEPPGDDQDLIARLIMSCESDGEAEEITTHSAIEAEHEPVISAPPEPPAPLPPSSNVSAPPVPQKAQTAVAQPVGESSISAQSLRVNVEVLEDLMTLVSELVLTRNQILQVSRAQKDNEMSGSLQRLNHIVSELQEGVMKTRMQPVSTAWAKLPRIIRDISSDLGKKIELEMLGQETELDRQVLEMIKDPLTHMVRNSCDHGIELPEQRRAAGKPETGTVRLNSYHEGGHIVIEISDDGKGLPLDKIKNKIVANKLASEADVAAMTPQQIQQYIFAAGFSTAEQVTAVSGRGVGMDVVRTNIEKIGGSIEMNSVEGKGTTFLIKIPLTLAIVSSLIVGIENDRFAVPQLDVSELLIVQKDGPNKIEMIDDTPVFRLRERILPLIDLRSLLGFSPPDGERPRYIAVIHVGSYSFGVIVERVFDTEEIVVKPLTSLLGGQSIFSGNTILGDGQVIMILDSAGILKASSISASSALSKNQTNNAEDIIDRGEEKTLLLFLAGDKNLKAVPLQHVARLEEVELEKVETAGGKRVVQYGDSLMPLYLYSSGMELPVTGRRPVIVFKTREGLSGLIVDRILDITSHFGDYQMKSDGALEGSAIIDGKATDIINLSYDRSGVSSSELPPADEFFPVVNAHEGNGYGAIK
jgi:two-component system chemotaxis sensor kinase CheA